MFGNRFDTSRARFGEEPVVIGLFTYASDARRALHALHEHHFAAEQLAAAFREPAAARAEAEQPSLPAHDSGKWFGHLRQIYRGDEGATRRGDDDSDPVVDANAVGFEAMLAQIDLSEEDAQMFNRDLDRGAAIVTVRAGARNSEAQALLEHRGARIVRNQQSNPIVALEPAAPIVIESTPFASPQKASPDHIQLFGEVLRVRKEKVSSGDVQVRKEAVTHMETVQVPVTREHLVIEHTDGKGSVDAEQTVRIPLSEERVHVDKDTVLREEYKVGKREITQNESVNDTVRRERLLIDEASANHHD
jgi:uncharacterized protein (TIGR02271 family)